MPAFDAIGIDDAPQFFQRVAGLDGCPSVFFCQDFIPLDLITKNGSAPANEYRPVVPPDIKKKGYGWWRNRSNSSAGRMKRPNSDTEGYSRCIIDYRYYFLAINRQGKYNIFKKARNI